MTNINQNTSLDNFVKLSIGIKYIQIKEEKKKLWEPYLYEVEKNFNIPQFKKIVAKKKK